MYLLMFCCTFFIVQLIIYMMSYKSRSFCTIIFAICKKSCTMKDMSMKLIKNIKDTTDLKNYGIMKKLRELGIEVTTQGIDGYEKVTARSTRLDVLCGLRKISGLNWDKFGKLLDSEFFKE